MEVKGIVPYPYHITADGDVQALPGNETFPDTAAKVLGMRSAKIPDVLTT